MDMAPGNFNMLKEPRGMIRIIQMLLVILAIWTTVGFETEVTVLVSCVESKNSTSVQHLTIYPVKYPFDFRNTPLEYLTNCHEGASSITTKKLQMYFDGSAGFYVGTGVASFIYLTVIMRVYLNYTDKYESNPMWPLGDLIVTFAMALSLLAGTSIWALTVSDLKYYTSPKNLMNYIPYCEKRDKLPEVLNTYCLPESPGRWSTLEISLVIGFAHTFVMFASMWFVYKATAYHKLSHEARDQVYPICGQPNDLVAVQLNISRPPQQQQQLQDQRVFG